MRGKATVWGLLFTFLCLVPGFAEPVPQDVLIFRTTNGSFPLTAEELVEFDRNLIETTGSLTPLPCLALAQTVDDKDVFLQDLSGWRERTLPLSYTQGALTLEAEQIQRLWSSLLILLPTVTQYKSNLVSATETSVEFFEVELSLNLTLYNVYKQSRSREFYFRTKVSATSQQEAHCAALREIIDQIKELGPDFIMLKNKVLAVRFNELVVYAAENQKIKTGHEYRIITHTADDTEREAGFVVIKAVGERTVLATPLIGQVRPGDELRAISSLGMEITPYFNLYFDPFNELELNMAAGLRLNWIKGLYTIRPFIGLEFPFSGTDTSIVNFLADYGIMMNLFAGIEMNFYFGRLNIVPELAAGVGLITAGLKPLTHYGGLVNININFYLMYRLVVCLNLGYEYWFNAASQLGTRSDHLSYGGIMSGIGLSFKL